LLQLLHKLLLPPQQLLQLLPLQQPTSQQSVHLYWQL
jgi:hypothetical protein